MEFISLSQNKTMGNIPLKFLPSQVSGLVLWSRFNTGITVAGSGVSQWDDQSGNGNHLKQPVDTQRPSKESDGSVLFDGVDNYLKSDVFTLVQPTSIYLLVKQLTWVSGKYLTDGSTGSTGVIWQNGTTPALKSFAGTNSAENSNLALGAYGVLATVFNSTNSVFQIDNTTALTGDFGNRDMAGLTLGGVALGGNYPNIQVKEVIMFNTAHDAAARAQVIKYLASVGGLSI